MGAAALITENLPYFFAGGGGTVISYYGWKFVDKIKRGPKITEPVAIDGRTHDEWYDLIKNMGKETFERMALGPLDGLERSSEYGWDYKKLLGDRWKMLEREWYPERFREPVKVASDRICVRSGKVYLTPNTANVSYSYNKDTVTVDSKAPVYNKPQTKSIWEGFFDHEKDELDNIAKKIAILEERVYGKNGTRKELSSHADQLDKEISSTFEVPSAAFGPPARKVQFKHMFGEMHQVFYVFEHKISLTRKQVMTLQFRLGLPADGLVGPNTIGRAQNMWLDDPGFKKIFGGYGVRTIR